MDKNNRKLKILYKCIKANADQFTHTSQSNSQHYVWSVHSIPFPGLQSVKHFAHGAMHVTLTHSLPSGRTSCDVLGKALPTSLLDAAWHPAGSLTFHALRLSKVLPTDVLAELSLSFRLPVSLL